MFPVNGQEGKKETRKKERMGRGFESGE